MSFFGYHEQTGAKRHSLYYIENLSRFELGLIAFFLTQKADKIICFFQQCTSHFTARAVLFV